MGRVQSDGRDRTTLAKKVDLLPSYSLTVPVSQNTFMGPSRDPCPFDQKGFCASLTVEG